MPPRSPSGAGSSSPLRQSPRSPRSAERPGLGAAAGILYAAGDVGTKAAVHGGARSRSCRSLLVCHGLAFVAMQLGFQRGGALATAGVATLLTNALPIAAGTLVFGEASVPGAALRVLALRSARSWGPRSGAETCARVAAIALCGRPGTI